MSDEKSLLLMIGMSRGAGKAVLGTPMVCEFLKKRGEKKDDGEDAEVLVIEASDSSENTHKRIGDKCKYYNVKHIRIKSTAAELGKAVGKGATAAVAITDRNFCIAVLNKLPKEG